MYEELVGYINSVNNNYLHTLLKNIFIEDKAFAERFKKASAAKSVHHGYIGGLLEHTLGVVKLCDYYCSAYPILNRELLITAAICHDMGKTREISAFPINDYTDEGQFLGHIVMGAEMIGERARQIEGFPPMLEMELKHCILSHHGEYEYGSPKKPAIVEAVALNFADNTDAKMETFLEILESTKETGWLGFNKLFDSNLRGTQV
jgi:3'-5' exoribonuclease